MKNILNALLVGFILTGYVSLTQANEYPASDFKPKVLYKDESYKPSASNSSAADSKYPATNFQPKVVYKDPNYKPSRSAKSSSRIRSSSSSTKTSTTDSYSKAEEKEGSDMTLVIGLVVLVLVGLFYVKNKNAPVEKKPARRKPSYKKAVASVGEGQSRVAKYLAEKQGGATGVAKYLASKKETASSSVAKYLAKRKVSERQNASAKASGVEKYLRNRT